MAYEFFRKYQRPILLSLTIFVLLTFSVTSVMTNVFEGWLRRGVTFPTITLPGGRVVHLTAEDYDYATALIRLSPRSPVPALVNLFSDSEAEGQDMHRTDVLAMLRRVAIEQGIEVSDHDVADAKKKAFDGLPYTSYEYVVSPQGLGLGSEGEYDRVVKEAIRISTLVRLQLLANDFSSEGLMEHVRKEKKETAFSVVGFPAKPHEEKLEASPPDDAALMQWIEKLPAHEQNAYKDSNHAAVTIVGLRLAEFDENDWTVELRDFKLDDTSIENRYNRDKETLYRKTPESRESQPGSKPASLPASGPASRDGTLPATRQGEREDGREKEKKDENGNVLQETATRAATRESQPGEGHASLPGETRPQTRPASDSTDVPTAHQATYVPLAEVKGQIEKRLKSEAVLGVLLTKAQDKAKADGDKFDFVKWAEELKKEKQDPKALVILEIKEPKSAEDLKTIEGLGTWQSSFQVGYVQKEGDLASAPQPTSEGALIFRAGKIVKEPFKPMEKIRPDALKDRVKKESMAQAKKDCEDFVAALRERAKTKVPDAVARIQEDKDKTVADKMKKWKESQEARLKEIEKLLAGGVQRVITQYTPVKERIEKELAAPADQEKKFRELVDKEKEDDVKKLVAPHLAEVFEEVAKEKTREVQKVGPFLPGIVNEPDFKTRYPDPIARFAIQSPVLKDVKKGSISECLEDATDRAHLVARVDERKLPAEEEISRNDFRQMRRAYEQARMKGALEQAFSFNALKQRYKFSSTRDTEETTTKPSQ